MRRFLLATLIVICAASVATCSNRSSGDKIPQVVEDLELAGEISIPGLSSPVEVVTDDRGIPHIYAQTNDDAIMAQGYLMARDRMGQMEFMRRAFGGRLAEVAGTLMPDLVNIDAFARFNRFTATAQKLLDGMDENDETLKSLEAFSAGINAHIAEHRSGEVILPGGLGSLLTVPLLTDWTPLDTLAIARYMTYDASPGPNAEIAFSEAALAIEQAFPSDDPDPLRAARADMLHDLFPFAPAENVFSRNGIPNVPDDGGTHAVRTPRPDLGRPPLPRRELLRKARGFYEGGSLFQRLYGVADKGSNNWVVHGSKTESGYPLMASDPHLGLDSPAKFWYAHLNTKRAGGDLDAQGLALAGTPGLLLGYTDAVAWGLTYAGHDTVDVYHEQITPGENGAPDTVLFNGQQVAIEQVQEIIKMNDGTEHVLTIEVVPHHGPIIASSRTDTEGLSVRWTGHQPTNEIKAIMGMLKARTAAEVETALDSFEVGAQCWSIITREGDVLWTCPANIPVRDPRARTYDPDTRTGVAPCFVLPGTGEYEWAEEYLSDSYVPHEINPEKGFGATANGDPVGNSEDGNPFNDAHYIAWEWDLGHRIARVTKRLQEVVDRGQVTPEDMRQIQADHHSPMGAKINPTLVAALDRALAEAATPGTHADLSDLVAGAAAAEMDRLALARDRLAAWTSLDTPAAAEGEPSQTEIADSVATSIFNAILPRLVNLSFGDEVDEIGVRPGDRSIGRTLQFAVLEPERLGSYDATLGDTVLWDDLTTTDVQETRDERMVRASLAALEYLEGKFGSDMEQWRWGELHTVVFETLIPLFETFNIPQAAEFAKGFPRPGDRYCVDASHPSIWNETSFSFGSGPQQRLVLEMTPEGPRAWNAIPGGQHHDPYSPHHKDEAEFWRKNEAPPLYFLEAEVVQHAEERIRLVP